MRWLASTHVARLPPLRRLGTRLTLAFAALAAVTVLVVLLALVAGRKATADIESTEEVRAPAWIASEQAQASLLRMQLHVRGYLVLGDRADIGHYQQARRDFERSLASLRAMAGQRPELDQAGWIAELTRIYGRWVQLPQELFDLHDDPLKNRAALRIARVDLQTLREQVLDRIDAVIALERSGEDSPSSRHRMSRLRAFQSSFDAMVATLTAYASSGDPGLYLAYGTQSAAHEDIGRALSAAGPGFSVEQRTHLEAIASDRARMSELALQLAGVLRSEHANEDLYRFRTEMAPRAQAMNALLGSVTASQQAQLRSELADARRHLADTRMRTMAGGAAAVVLALAMALVFRRRIVGPVQRLTAVAERVAAGDLSARASTSQCSDEIGVLSASIDTMTQRLSDMIAEAERAKDAAVVANRAKSSFLAAMSHELRTPLNGVLGFAQILQRDKPLTERQQRGLRVIQESGQRLLALINDILDLASIDASRLELMPAEIHLPDLLHAVCDIVRPKAQEKGLHFRHEAGPGLPIAVFADNKRLRQVLLNLLSNAVKFTDRGEVGLHVGVVGPPRGGIVRLRFEVRDSGIGMSRAQLDRLFEPFEAAGGADRREGGSGLGLALSRRLVRLMGGDIDVRSEPGRGSVFSFEVELPLAQGAKTSFLCGRDTPLGYEGARKRILVVDDVVENRTVLVDALSVLGFDVHEAADGAECLDRVRTTDPDLLIMDTVMPVMDGFTATRAVRRMPGRADVPIIATSASATPQVRHQCLEAGANDFIPKPIDQDRLLDAMGRLLGLRWIGAGDTAGVPEQLRHHPRHSSATTAP